MDPIYTVIIAILAVLAVSGLFVGVTNDAVNFLNSAIGSKAAPRRVILIVASIGILVGTLTSSGMMEVARNGMFDPGMFSFHEVILLYLSVMFANIILLDLYNSWGLPTSTTVSLIFCLLGAAIAVSTFKIAGSDALSMGDLGEFIHTGRAFGIVAAILLSVVIALTVGTAVMYVSRLIFSFRYTRALSRYGALWCGASLTAIIYFALFKGLKGTLSQTAFIHMVENHIILSLLVCWLVCSLILFFVQRFKINILRITILGGTFALALAFAGNDLVNFIGVPIAGWDAFRIARHAGDSAMTMDALNENVPANFAFLVGAGVVMILTLWTSRKAMHVTETELSLASQNDEQEQREYGSSAFARAIVRATLNTNHAIERVVPQRLREAISRRFEVTDIEHTGAPFDMIRATVNLTTSALLIAMATSLKLPLSTTYVTFMVAMGSSLADRAWGRETAVYRISGVMTVVALAYVIYANFASFPADVDPDNLFEGRKNSCSLLGALLGFCVGYTLERKYIRFETKAVWWAQVLKAVLGLAITIGLRAALKAPLLALCGGHNVANLIRYALMVIFAAGIWPMTFGWCGRLGQKKPASGASD